MEGCSYNIPEDIKPAAHTVAVSLRSVRLCRLCFLSQAPRVAAASPLLARRTWT
jgi:hypothetical protein